MPSTSTLGVREREKYLQVLESEIENEGESPAQNDALRSILCHQRDVKESTLLRYMAMQDPTAASGDFDLDGNLPAAPAIPERSILGIPMLDYTSKFLQAWSILILVLDSLYTALWVPIVAAFELPHSIRSVIGAIDFAVGVILCIDILLRFHSPITLKSTYKKVVLTHPGVVARFYAFKGSFMLDVIAAVPLVIVPWVPDAGSIYLILIMAIRSLRLWRVRRVLNAIFYIQMMSVAGMAGWRMLLGSIFSTLYTIGVMTNFLACLWYFIGTWTIVETGEDSRGWLAQEYKFNGLFNGTACDTLYCSEAAAEDVPFPTIAHGMKLWSVSVYYVIVTLTTVGYGDITPTTSAEIWTTLVIMICGLAVFGAIISSVSEIMASASAKSRHDTAVRSKLKDVQQWMGSNPGLGLKTRQDVIRFYAEDWTIGHDDEVILSELPTDVRTMAIWDLLKKDFLKVQLFGYLSVTDKGAGVPGFDAKEEACKAVAAKMHALRVTRGTHVIKQGSNADSVYFLQRGEVEVLHLGRRVATLTAPVTFGEAALLRFDLKAAEKRLSGYRTTLTSLLWKLDVDELYEMKAIIPDVKSKMLRGIKRNLVVKLYTMQLNFLELIRIFLQSMGVEASQASIDTMVAGLIPHVDMSLVQILAFFDRRHYQVTNATSSAVLSSTSQSRPDALFVPHSVPEGLPLGPASSQALDEGGSPLAGHPATIYEEAESADGGPDAADPLLNKFGEALAAVAAEKDAEAEAEMDKQKRTGAKMKRAPSKNRRGEKVPEPTAVPATGADGPSDAVVTVSPGSEATPLQKPVKGGAAAGIAPEEADKANGSLVSQGLTSAASMASIGGQVEAILHLADPADLDKLSGTEILKKVIEEKKQRRHTRRRTTA